MSSEDEAGGWVLLRVPADQVRKAEPGEAGTPAHGEWVWLDSREDWDLGPFEVGGDEVNSLRQMEAGISSSGEQGASPAKVWVAETWGAHGDGAAVQGVYDSRESAWDGLKGRVDTLYVDDAGCLCGKPRDENGPFAEWACAHPMEVKGRKQPEPS